MSIPALTDDGRRFVSDYHLATLSTMGPSGGIHVVAVGFTFVDGVVRIITSDASQKVRNIERDARATVAQLSGPQWLSIAGSGSDPAGCRRGGARRAALRRPLSPTAGEPSPSGHHHHAREGSRLGRPLALTSPTGAGHRTPNALRDTFRPSP